MSSLNWNQQSKETLANSFKTENLGGTASALLSGISGIAEGGISNAKIANTSDIESDIADTKNAQFNYGDYDSLLNAYNNSLLQNSNYERGDVRGVKGGAMALNTVKGVGSGALTGLQVGGPWGAIIGAAVGLAGSTAGIIAGNSKANIKASQLNRDATIANNAYLANFSNNANNIANSMFNNSAINIAAEGGKIKSQSPKYYGVTDYFAYGGDLDLSGEFSNGVTIVGEGGTHEENKYDGVLMGMDENGIPNLVEEGEVIFNDYVFSNRLKPTEEQLEDNYLKKSYSGKSFADIAKLIQKESSESPFDPISRNTLEDNLNKLMIIQEEIRNEDTENNEFAFGGRKYAGPTDSSNPYGQWLKVPGKYGIGQTRGYYSQSVNPWNYYYLMYAANNNYAPDNLNFNDTPQQSIKNQNINQSISGNASISSNDTKTEVPLQDNRDLSKIAVDLTISDKAKRVLDNNKEAGLAPKTKFTDIPNTTGRGLDYNISRYAPIISSGLQYLGDIIGQSNKVDYTNPNLIRNAARRVRNVSSRPVGATMTYNPFDINYEQNRLANQSLATQDAILASSSGNRAAAVANLASLNNNTNNQMGSLALNASQSNLSQRNMISQFNLNRDSINAQNGINADARNQAADIEKINAAYREAMMRDNIETVLSSARSTNATNFWNNVGNYGTDDYYKDQADWWIKNVAPYNAATRQYRYAGKGGFIKRGLTF